MKKTLTALLLLFFIGCEEYENPNFSAEPFITFKDLKFIEGEPMADSIQLTFSYRDGDMDLGLSHEALDSPYHRLNLFVEDGTSLLKVSANSLYIAQGLFPVIAQSQKEGKKLVAYRTRKKASFGFLPELGCKYYANMEILIPGKNRFLMDDFTNVLETLTQNSETYYKILDTLYYEINPYHYSIDVDFLVEQANSTYEEFDWRANFCTSYNGRFPVIIDPQKGPQGSFRSGPFFIKPISNWEGEIVYTMASHGFRHLFEGKKLKLNVTVFDRALHTSNTIETSAILIQ
jgi:hypothetical protein